MTAWYESTTAACSGSSPPMNLMPNHRHHHQDRQIDDEDMMPTMHQNTSTSASSSTSVRQSANMTECVPVPSSEHVAEIVGRQGQSNRYVCGMQSVFPIDRWMDRSA